MLSLAFLIVALVLLIIAAVKPDVVPTVSAGWLGLAFWAASQLVGRL